jgi:hypothetical protein
MMKNETPGQDFGTLHTGGKIQDCSDTAPTAGTKARHGRIPKRIIHMKGGVTTPAGRNCLTRDHNTHKGR